MTVAELLKYATGIASDTPQLDAQVILAHVLGCTRTYLYTWPEKTVAKGQEEVFFQLLERRKRGEPVAYLVGQQEFWSLTLRVSPATLIPRAETELLVERILQIALPATARVLDLGTGTGAIALALASERPNWEIVAVDCQPEAVELAKSNASRHRLGNVNIFQSDWFTAVTGNFDLIVSNPPYIAGSDPHLEVGDVKFEPRSALVSGDDGLADIEQIVSSARRHLDPGGWLVLEHGYDQGESVRSLLVANDYLAVESIQDLAGLPRITLGRISKGGGQGSSE